jgi:hypothetical protein
VPARLVLTRAPLRSLSAVLGGPEGRARVKLTIFHIKLVHTAIFWVLSGCVLFTLFSGLAGRVTLLTWVSVGLVVVEGVVLVVSGWVCPLTLLAERLGATRGSVADIFLPRWLADRIFPVCTTTFVIACAIIAARLLVGR